MSGSTRVTLSIWIKQAKALIEAINYTVTVSYAAVFSEVT